MNVDLSSNWLKITIANLAFPKRMNFRKRGVGWVGGWVIFNPKTYVADFGPLNRAFWAWHQKTFTTWFFRKWGGEGQRPFGIFPKNHLFWRRHSSLRKSWNLSWEWVWGGQIRKNVGGGGIFFDIVLWWSHILTSRVLLTSSFTMGVKYSVCVSFIFEWCWEFARV